MKWPPLCGNNSTAKKSLRDIKHRLSEEYEVSAEEAENDLSEYIAQLKEIEAVTRMP